MTREILAVYDQDGVWVYQAFKPSTVKAALAKGTFGDGFAFDRMTWIKPSFGWMLYRSGYGEKPGQEGILRIKLSHDGFGAILDQAVLSTFDPEVHASKEEWGAAVNKSEVRCQWDPDRDLKLARLDRRAIQLGLRGSVVKRYVDEWILKLEEVTDLAQEIHKAVKTGKPLPEVPEERLYPTDPSVARRLGM